MYCASGTTIHEYTVTCQKSHLGDPATLTIYAFPSLRAWPRVRIQILIPEVVIALAHHGGEVGVAAHERQRLARRHVEVAGHLVQAEAAVHAARVGRLVGLLPPAGKSHH